MAYPNAGRNLVPITAGVNYTRPPKWNSGTTYNAGDLVSYANEFSPATGGYSNYAALVGSNTANNPADSQGFWKPVSFVPSQPPIFCLLCTTTSTGATTLLAVNDTTAVTFPAGAFVKGQQYDIYLAELVTAGGATFVGYR